MLSMFVSLRFVRDRLEYKKRAAFAKVERLEPVYILHLWAIALHRSLHRRNDRCGRGVVGFPFDNALGHFRPHLLSAINRIDIWFAVNSRYRVNGIV